MSNNITAFVQPHELTTPDLSPSERNNLWTALNLVVSLQNQRALLGADARDTLGEMGVFVGLDYRKQTDSPARVEGSDYSSLPGVSCYAQFGPVCRVFRRKDGAVRFTIWSIPRQNYTTIIPDGIRGFAVMPMPEIEGRQKISRDENPQKIRARGK